MFHFNEKPSPVVKFMVKSYRKYGQPKLKKPKEIRGIPQILSVPYNPKCKCQVFVKENDVWVKHRDYFSPSLVAKKHRGKSLNQLMEIYLGKGKKGKFVYGDSWGDIIARAEAWIELKGLMTDIRNKVFTPKVVSSILRQQEVVHGMRELELEYTYSGNYMVRFWEKVVCGLMNTINEEVLS